MSAVQRDFWSVCIAENPSAFLAGLSPARLARLLEWLEKEKAAGFRKIALGLASLEAARRFKDSHLS